MCVYMCGGISVLCMFFEKTLLAYHKWKGTWRKVTRQEPKFYNFINLLDITITTSTLKHK